MSQMTINDIRRIIEQSQNNNLMGGNVIKSGLHKDKSGQAHQYDISRGWSDSLAWQCNTSWGQFNLKILQNIDSRPISEDEKHQLISDSSLEDIHWNWLAKHAHYYSSQFEWFFVTINGEPQAACLIYHPENGALTSAPIFYIEYLAVAPWNRPNLVAEQRFKGIGPILIKEVIHFAKDTLGLTEGFSLHSLPKAQSFYTKIGMQAISAKDKDSLAYYEMGKIQLAKFLEA
ncbi:GNAT family N-acetyltransferase [Nitrincola sp.]|uniref:GNAT family N-acetyltransferase n=1 Tax=Nitrincola sp. TaxID=1926584 RepID=UPI003A8E8B36